MIHSHGHRGIRQAFTLIELLVVMAIIATLIALLGSGVMAVMGVRYRMQTQYEITKMTEAMNAAMADFPGKPKTLPSKLKLYNDLSQYQSDNTTLGKQSRAALRQMFGQRLFTPANTVTWNSSATITTLEGHQCLVFYLGGAQVTTGTIGCLGFSTDPRNPMAGGNTKRYGPYFDFKSSRLRLEANGFLSYIDPFRNSTDPLAKPYTYFSTFGTDNNYNTATGTNADCPSIIPPFVPYFSGNNQFSNPSSFQIISAGKDGLFGPGGSVWTPSSGTSDSATMDNLTNFTKSQLVGPQS